MSLLHRLSTSARLTLFIALAYLTMFFVIGTGVYVKVSAQLENDTRNFVLVDAEELRKLYVLKGRDELVKEIETRVADPDEADMFYVLLDADGTRLAGRANPFKHAPAADQWLSFKPDGRGGSRALARTYNLNGMTLVAGMMTRAEDGFLQTTLRAAWMSLLFAALLSGLLAWMISKWIAVRLTRLGDTAQRVADGHMSRRVDVGQSGDAFDRIGIQFNHMLDRIEELIGGVRQVSDHIAHDLRTPLTQLRNELVALKGRAEKSVVSPMEIETSIQRTDQLLATFAAILRVSRLESDPIVEHHVPLDLARLCEDAVELYEPVAQARDVRFICELAPATVRGERDQLFQMIVNLLDNAVKYSPAGSAVTVTTHRDANEVSVSVSDQGPGIPEADHARVFTRFERLEHHRGTPGNGLGLSLVRAVALRHGGTLALSDAAPGLTVICRFPVTQA